MHGSLNSQLRSRLVSEVFVPELLRYVVFIDRIRPGDYESGLRTGVSYSYTPEWAHKDSSDWVDRVPGSLNSQQHEI